MAVPVYHDFWLVLLYGGCTRSIVCYVQQQH